MGEEGEGEFHRETALVFFPGQILCECVVTCNTMAAPLDLPFDLH